MTLHLNDLDLLDGPAVAPTGLPIQLAVDSIDEDPSQPRLQFDDEPLQELAASITERGVLQAISVRSHPKQAGRWILNFGARRLRASRLAGRLTIPAFVNETADSYDQFIENEQREGLNPLELALFVQRRLAAGDSQVDIARHTGKSKAYVTFATALIDAPDCLMTAYREGRCRGLFELYELRRLHDTAPRLVEDWLRAATSITRTEVAALKARVRCDVLPESRRLDQSVPQRGGDEPVRRQETLLLPARAGISTASPQGTPHRSDAPSSLSDEALHESSTAPVSRAHSQAIVVTLWGKWQGSDVTVDLRTAPEQDDQVCVIRATDGQRLAIPAQEFRLCRVVQCGQV